MYDRKRISELLTQWDCADHEAATRLNEQGFTTKRGRSFTWHTVNYFKHNLMFKPRKQQPPTQSVSQPGNRQLIDVVLASNLGREDKARILAGLV